MISLTGRRVTIIIVMDEMLRAVTAGHVVVIVNDAHYGGVCLLAPWKQEQVKDVRGISVSNSFSWRRCRQGFTEHTIRDVAGVNTSAMALVD
ncbi:hypothetical protein EWM64_g5214 [Hericium alpestre]|uniref:Uncharacterized protein n=1 Tax=Hericium alpestre TaxID=135208 RepID=A0A4Y9ZZD4_9AGAM|nr:hypothetical protein EWM64_g5214 [Hericium alpestre]